MDKEQSLPELKNGMGEFWSQRGKGVRMYLFVSNVILKNSLKLRDNPLHRSMLSDSSDV